MKTKRPKSEVEIRIGELIRKEVDIKDRLRKIVAERERRKHGRRPY